MARSPAGNPTPPARQEPSYEQALAELDRLVEQMEAGQMPLDQLLDGYKRGAELLALCRERLEKVDEQVKLLEDGQLKPWAPTT
jgi:exodeoxyribonuclease VII small subunit